MHTLQPPGPTPCPPLPTRLHSTHSTCREWVRADGSSAFPPAAGRYRLYVSLACPWACRCLSARKLKGLEDAIDIAVVNPVWERTKPDDADDVHRGWVFTPGEGVVPDPEWGVRSVRELYERAGADVAKFTVPVLFDTHTKSIVNNESADIFRMLNREFNSVAQHPEVDLCPDDLVAAIDYTNEWVYTINNGVYKAGFATKQEPYVRAIEELYESLDRAEDILSRQRYLVDPARMTESDIRLFVTLVRFDPVYSVHFKCAKRRIAEYPALLGYMRDMYQTCGLQGTVNMSHIKNHYYRSHPTVNPYGIVPVTAPQHLDAPHGREGLMRA